jgi:GT2 family glycosyltransferase
MEQKPKTILIGMPCGSGMVPALMLQSMLALRKPLPSAFLAVERQRTDKARNALVKEALDKGCDYLFMVDDDNPIPEDTLEKFLEDDKDVLIAPILGRNPDKDGNFKLCAFYKEDRDFDGQNLRTYHNIQQFRDDGPLHRIDAGGTGAMLIKRAVLEKLWEKYPGEVFAYGDVTVGGQRRTMSEDAEFCERAVDAGFEIWLDERVRPVHLGAQRAIKWMP